LFAYHAGLNYNVIGKNSKIDFYFLPGEGARAVREGVNYQTALAALTKNAPPILGIGRRVGSLKPGMDADLVIWDGEDPFHYRTRVEQVFINGRKVYENI